MTVDVTEHHSLAIQQWQGATRFMALVRALLRAVQDEHVAPLQTLDGPQSNLDTATGVFLDSVGRRLGFPRPYIASSGVVWFGFRGGDDVGFDQAPFRSTLDELQVLTPLGDMEYRKLLQARRILVVGAGTLPDYEEALEAAGVTGTVIDGLDGTLTITVPFTGDLLEIWRRLLRGPAGVATTVSTT